MDCAQSRDEVVFCGANGALRCVASVYAGGRELEGNGLLVEEQFQCVRTLVVEHYELGA